MTSHFVEIGPSDAYPLASGGSAVPPLADRDRQVHAPDTHILLMAGDSQPTTSRLEAGSWELEAGVVLSRCSCWWTDAPAMPGERVGVIGHYAAADAESGRALLSYACARARRAECTYVIGPMDGNTWRSYRLVTDRGTEPPFFLEPWTAEAWVSHWKSAGFAPIAEYTSALNSDLTRADPRVGRAVARLADGGVSIRPLNVSDAERDLRRIFALSLESFSRNFLYAPIAEAEFLEQNHRLLPFVRPELVLLAERDDSLAGFVFAVPDVLQTTRGVPVDTVVIKTVAVAPTMTSAGLGSVLVSRVQAIAHELGFTRAVHALMHERNVSQNISRRYATTIRRYALFGRAL